VIRLEDGRGIPLAIIPEYIGTVSLEEGRVVNVSYTPSRNSNRYTDYQPVAEEVEKRRAVIAVASRKGHFLLDPAKASEDAAYLRTLKNLDPTLGIYAAYAYSQA